MNITDTEDLQGTNLFKFAEESDRIEGIFDLDRHIQHTQALRVLLSHGILSQDALIEFVSKIEPKAKLRMSREEDRVYIGGHEAPRAPDSREMLIDLLMGVNLYHGTGHIPKDQQHRAWLYHSQYEFIHPFTDGNGRSGRALWLWLLRDHNPFRYSFLQSFYYQSLAAYSRKQREETVDENY